MARRCVWSRNLENEEANVRYGAVENTTTMGCNAKKANKQTIYKINLGLLVPEDVSIASLQNTDSHPRIFEL